MREENGEDVKTDKIINISSSPDYTNHSQDPASPLISTQRRSDPVSIKADKNKKGFFGFSSANRELHNIYENLVNENQENSKRLLKKVENLLARLKPFLEQSNPGAIDLRERLNNAAKSIEEHQKEYGKGLTSPRELTEEYLNEVRSHTNRFFSVQSDALAAYEQDLIKLESKAS